MPDLLVEGPFESDYSLALVNRRLAKALLARGLQVDLYQRDGTTAYFPSDAFLRQHGDLKPHFLRELPPPGEFVHSRFLYPPHTDGFKGSVRAFHCYAWEESGFPRRYVDSFNRQLDVVTVLSNYVRAVLERGGVSVPVAVAGCGADHILEEPSHPVDGFPSDAFTFLHVSSCFPRKGADALIEAFFREFSGGDGVELVIKTFANPHNEVERMVAEARERHGPGAPVRILWQPLRPGQMRWLYEHAGCLVAPSRGEGFGLPVAEAMFAGCPIVATLHGGHADLCSEESAWPVEFHLEQARTHLTEGASLWAEPSVDSLRRQMRAVLDASGRERRARTEAARARAAHFTWARVAAKHWEAVAEARQQKERAIACRFAQDAKATIGFVTTWNARCGIAEYARYLASNLPGGFRQAVFASHAEPERRDEPFVMRCWEPDGGSGDGDAGALVRAILDRRPDAVSIQFNFGFFSPARLHGLLAELRRHGIPAAVTMHATRHPNLARLIPALAKARWCFCHRKDEAAALAKLGLKNVRLLPHGIPAPPPGRDERHEASRRAPDAFVLACFGFLLPAKGIHHLLAAFAMARTVMPGLHLKLLTALYPIPESERYAAYCLELIARQGLGSCVSVNTRFVDDAFVLEELSAADLVVLPYPSSSESSSAAVRLPLASLTPVLCSDIPLFDEFADCLHRFPAGDAIALANRILQLAAEPGELHRFKTQQASVVERYSWKGVARDFAELLVRK